jgi:hypothetical protein
LFEEGFVMKALVWVAAVSLAACMGEVRDTDKKDGSLGRPDDSGDEADASSGGGDKPFDGGAGGTTGNAGGGTMGAGVDAGRDGGSRDGGTAGDSAVGDSSGGGTTGGAGTDAGGGTTGGGGIAEKCQGTTTLPADAPKLTVGRWVDVTPAGIPKGRPDDVIGQGLVMDPCNSAVLYWGTTPYDEEPYSGLYRSTNGGASWTRLGDRRVEPQQEKTAYLDMPLRIEVDPKNPRHLYAGDGVRGATMGFWISNDAGETWTKPAALIALGERQQYFLDDVYDIAVDPTDFKHVLVSSHSEWGDAGSGVLESKDGGNTWVAHAPRASWGTGHSINFLYEPTLGIGNANTWLLGTQADGYWRTSDAGKTWTQVFKEGIFHGGGEIYYTKAKTLFASCESGVLRSTNNGETFTAADFGYGTTGIIGDGTTLYTTAAYGFNQQPMYTSPESDGLNWTAFNTQTLDGGPFGMVHDSVNHIIYSSNWSQGVWALKLK